MSISNVINIAQTALRTHQRAIDVIGHNIANESTPGFTRQRLNLKASVPQRVAFGQLGRGVTIEGLQRMRSTFVDQGLRDETAGERKFGTLNNLLGRVEMIFGEPSELGIASSLDAFYSAFGDLANDPSSSSARSALRNTAQRLTNQFRSVSRGIDDIATEVQSRLQGSARDMNSFLRSIANLNVRINSGEAGGRSAPDLRDQRDLLLDQLSRMADITVTEEGGTLRVSTGSIVLVEGADVHEVAVRVVGGGFGIGLASETETFGIASGSMGALIDMSQTEIPGIRTKMDKLAAELVNQVNTLHVTGVTGDGGAAREFFDPNGLTAASIDLEADIKASATAIAAGTVPGGGDASLALKIAGLRETKIGALDNRTLGSFYGDVVVGLGLTIREADLGQQSQATLVSSLTNQRASLSSVSLDEEMINLIGSQQAYAAATRLVSAADEMVRDLLNMV